MQRMKLKTVLDKSTVYDRHALHTAVIGRVESFDSATQTVKVLVQTPIGDNDYKNSNSQANFPLLLQVPVVYPQGGGFCLTFPIEAGDCGQVIFNERSIREWWESGQARMSSDCRAFDLSDGVFIPGVVSQPKALKDYAVDEAQFRDKNGKGVIAINPDGGVSIRCKALTITADQIVLNGAVSCNGLNLNDHRHGGVVAGSNTTSQPVP